MASLTLEQMTANDGHFRPNTRCSICVLMALEGIAQLWGWRIR